MRMLFVDGPRVQLNAVSVNVGQRKNWTNCNTCTKKQTRRIWAGICPAPLDWSIRMTTPLLQNVVQSIEEWWFLAKNLICTYGLFISGDLNIKSQKSSKSYFQSKFSKSKFDSIMLKIVKVRGVRSICDSFWKISFSNTSFSRKLW